jgi:DNA-binding NtrC family response regulator
VSSSDESVTTAVWSTQAGRPSKRVLLVMSQSGVFTRELPIEGELSIGRGIECDLRIEDIKASRKHALVRIGERCTIEDAGSTNGTRLGDRTLAPHQPVDLRPGEMVSIGSTVIVLQSAAEHAPLRLWSAAAFDERFEAERQRAAAKGTTFALLSLSIGEASTALASTSSTSRISDDASRAQIIEQAFRECLRPADVVGSTAPGRFSILLPATSPDEALAIAALLRRYLRERGVGQSLTLSCLPRDGDSRAAVGDSAQVVEEEDEAPKSIALEAPLEGKLTPMLERIAGGEINVLILGETGVGKEVLARTIHLRSPRGPKSLVCINCAALSETLLESELFGHEKGAFTGATNAKQGLLESADGGTIFLDEVGEMPLSLQAKLLRVLEQREVLRVGSLRPRAIDVRFLAATNRDLEGEVASGRFRQDLYFRLNGVSVVVPPLRERTDEIAPLARAFVKQISGRSRRATVPTIAPQVNDLLRRYPWPGNVRELRNMMERAVLLTPGDVITPESFPSEMMVAPVVALRSPANASAASRATIPPGKTATDMGIVGVTVKAGDALREAVEIATGDERERIIAALDAAHGNQTVAAKMLGISRRTLVTRLGEYDLPRPRKKT